MPIDLPPQYDPKSVEKAIYQKWLDARAFHAVPDARPPQKRFSMVIPPPNVTGALHLGHAINGTIQDILARYHRMKGDNTLWMPGIDHAGIATQAVVEKTIFEKEKKNRHDLGREELVRRIWEWKEQFGTRILAQLASIGASCDWDRTRFTLDEICAKAVREAFFKMFKDGLIFRGKRLVNWDTHLQTAVADDEIYHETVKGQLTSIKYPVAPSEPRPSGSDVQEYLIVATTRPETMLGDTAVAVHPDDPRYKHLHGKHVILPLVGRKIPVICDGLLVDPKFGTGVVKVTPAHDPNDYATGVRHNLEQINLLTPDGKVNENGQGEFLGKKYSYVGLKFATAARKQVLADLEALGLIAETKVHEHEIGHSDRSKTPIEPYLSDQWFVRMGDITSPQSEPRPLGSDRSAAEDGPVHSNAAGYFISFHTYATWLHGQDPGSVDPDHNVPGTPFIAPDPALLQRKFEKASQPPMILSLEQRQSVLRTILEVSQHRGWTIHAVNVRTTHVHVVVSGKKSPERMMNDFKSYATRRLAEAGLLPRDAKIWSRHGSTPYLWKLSDIAGAVDYVLNRQGENTVGTFFHTSPSEPRPLGSDNSVATSTGSLPNGRGSDRESDGITLADGTRAPGLAQAAMDAVTSGRVKITPERYAKGYLDWLGQKRDWCISRQLWWGHRIPVWTYQIDVDSLQHASRISEKDHRAHEAVISWQLQHSANVAVATSLRPENLSIEGQSATGFPWPEDGRLVVCIKDSPEIEGEAKSLGFVQDPDVLDTWFSSALWPISTMGWPNSNRQSEPRPSGSDPLGSPSTQSLPHGRGSDGLTPEPGLLPYFYPTSLLSTAREILTLWVARMVIFGLYCHGDVPFKDVYIHAVIQDGEGRPMKKSLGNGVDPVDIVNSHGADALRFTLAAMATETQDIRMPVVKDAKTGHNSSPKFDLGRNFANKIWNASRFILNNIDATSQALNFEQADRIINSSSRLAPPEDVWILGKLHTTIYFVEESIKTYKFASLAQNLYEFFWTDLCDWYVEISKARLKKGDTDVQAILLYCIETSLCLLHPVMPFITEELWSKLPNRRSLLISASWPQIDYTRMVTSSLNRSQAELLLADKMRITKSIVTAVRDIHNRYPAAKGRDIILKPMDKVAERDVEAWREIIQSLTGAAVSQNSTEAIKPANAAMAILPECQIFIGGVIDKAVEVPKLTKRQAELEKLIAGIEAKLANETFTSKAPPHIVQGLRDQLAKLVEELAAIVKNLKELQ